MVLRYEPTVIINEDGDELGPEMLAHPTGDWINWGDHQEALSQEWISVEDELPPPYEPVFIWPRPEFSNTVYDGIYRDDNKSWVAQDDEGFDVIVDVTHFQRIPGPPTKGV